MRYKIYRNEEMFGKDFNDDSAYILGLLISDGSINTNGQLSLYLKSSDKELVQEVYNRFVSNPGKLIETTNDRIGFCINNKTITRDLAKFDVIPNKTYFDIKYPTLQDSHHVHFLRGLIDGDGTVGNGYVQFLGSKSLLEGVANIIHQLIGIDVPKVYKRSDANIYRLKIYRGYMTLLDLIYKDAMLYMARKKDVYESIQMTSDITLSHQGDIRCSALKLEDVRLKYKNLLDNFVKENNRTPTYNEFRYIGSIATVAKYWGNFNAFINAHGYVPRLPIKMKV